MLGSFLQMIYSPNFVVVKKKFVQMIISFFFSFFHFGLLFEFDCTMQQVSYKRLDTTLCFANKQWWHNSMIIL